MRTIAVVACASILACAPLVTVAKEYNQAPHLAPEQRAKVDKTIAKAYGSKGGEGVGEGVSNVGCGKLEVGTIEQGSKAGQKVEQDIIITGDVINVAAGCRGNAQQQQ